MPSGLAGTLPLKPDAEPTLLGCIVLSARG